MAMKEYKIPRYQNREDIHFEAIDAAYISEYPWGGSYRPKTAARIAYLENEEFIVQITCEESAPKAVYCNYMDPVYKDSCVEFFFCFDWRLGYVNCEMNANGTLLCAYGEQRENRIPVLRLTDDLPMVSARKNAREWSVRLHLPVSMIYKLYSRAVLCRDFEFYGNFYKCGDDTEYRHYGVWNPVCAPKPDFHRPESFGKFILC